MCERWGTDEETTNQFEALHRRITAVVDKTVEQMTRPLYVFCDAEQTFIQDALDSYTRLLQEKYHQGRPAFIMNGYQSYLTNSNHVVNLEMARCEALGIGELMTSR